MAVATKRVARQGGDDTTAARRRQRYAARHTLWDESALTRLRKCGRIPIESTGVGVRVTRGLETGSDVAGYSGLSTCGSVWACPVCSAKILAHRQDELQRALAAWQERGGSVGLLTLTMRHRAGQKLSELWDALSYAWGKATSGRGWVQAQAKWGSPVERRILQGKRKGHYANCSCGDSGRVCLRKHAPAERSIGWVRATEGTIGDNGWHLHVHAALMLPRGCSDRELDELACDMFQRWRDALQRRGLDAPLARARDGSSPGVKAQLWDGKTGVLSEYFTKNTYSADVDDLAAEVTRGDFKTGRGRSRTPFEILRDVVVMGVVDDLDLWHEWEAASSGRRQLTWSTGLRDLLLPGEEEREGEDIVQDDHDGATELLLPMPTWKYLVTSRQTLDLLEVAELGVGCAEAWLTVRGLDWQRPAPPTEAG